MFKGVEVSNTKSLKHLDSGAATTIENGRVLCSKCNASKGAC